MAKAHRFKHLKKLSLFGDGNDDFFVFCEKLSIGNFALLKSSEKCIEELVINGEATYDRSEATFASMHSSDITSLPSLRRLR